MRQRRTTSNLITQIEFCKNYSGHRRRLDSRYRSPLPTQKSMSFDHQKMRFDAYLKERKEQSNDFAKREQYKAHLTNDAIMLRKILEYKPRVNFTMRTEPDRPALLHHNAMVSQHRLEARLSQENEKIHQRIVKAQRNSLYSKDLMQSKTFVLNKINSKGMFQASSRNRSFNKMYNEYQEESLAGNLSDFRQPEGRQEESGQQGEKEYQAFQRSPEPRLQIQCQSWLVCDRVRKQRLASKLYEKKIRLQTAIGPKVQCRR